MRGRLMNETRDGGIGRVRRGTRGIRPSRAYFNY